MTMRATEADMRGNGVRHRAPGIIYYGKNSQYQGMWGTVHWAGVGNGYWQVLWAFVSRLG